jgi:hypothetical protein
VLSWYDFHASVQNGFLPKEKAAAKQEKWTRQLQS